MHCWTRWFGRFWQWRRKCWDRALDSRGRRDYPPICGIVTGHGRTTVLRCTVWRGWVLRLLGPVFKDNDKGILFLWFFLLAPSFPSLGFHWNFHSRNVLEAHSHGSLLLFPRRLEHFWRIYRVPQFNGAESGGRGGALGAALFPIGIPCFSNFFFHFLSYAYEKKVLPKLVRWLKESLAMVCSQFQLAIY